MTCLLYTSEQEFTGDIPAEQQAEQPLEETPLPDNVAPLSDEPQVCKLKKLRKNPLCIEHKAMQVLADCNIVRHVCNFAERCV